MVQHFSGNQLKSLIFDLDKSTQAEYQVCRAPLLYTQKFHNTTAKDVVTIGRIQILIKLFFVLENESLDT